MPHRRYELETALLQATQQETALKQRLPRAKYDLRCAQAALTEYEHGSIKKFFDKISGRQEEKLEALRSHLRKAEAALKLAQQEQETVSRQLNELNSQLNSMPGWDELRTQSGEAARLEALLLAGMLIPALEENYAALTQSRAQLRGEHSMELMSYETLHGIHARAEQSGETCRGLLERMKNALDAAEIPFEIPTYYRAPTAYTAGAGDKFHRLDRVSSAMDQALETKKQIIGLQQKLDQ